MRALLPDGNRHRKLMAAGLLVAVADSGVGEEVWRGVVEPPTETETELEVLRDKDMAATTAVSDVGGLLLAVRHDPGIGIHPA